MKQQSKVELFSGNFARGGKGPNEAWDQTIFFLPFCSTKIRSARGRQRSSGGKKSNSDFSRSQFVCPKNTPKVGSLYFRRGKLVPKVFESRLIISVFVGNDKRSSGSEELTQTFQTSLYGFDSWARLIGLFRKRRFQLSSGRKVENSHDPPSRFWDVSLLIRVRHLCRAALCSGERKTGKVNSIWACVFKSHGIGIEE